VLRIINEPTAASLAYGFSEENSKERQRLAVFDLGGGTFDISILEIGEGMCQVVSTNGDTFLGGEDFDETVLQYLMNEFKKKEGVDLSKDVFAIQRLREGAEKAKKALDHMPAYEINLPFITREKNFSYSLTKDKFNELIKPLVDRTVKPCQSALKVSVPSSTGRDSQLFGLTMPLVCLSTRPGCRPLKGGQRDPRGRYDPHAGRCGEGQGAVRP
jgi:molecular chaperone DnaK